MAESKIPQLARDQDKQFNNRWAGVRKKLTDIYGLFGDEIYIKINRKNGGGYVYETADFDPNSHGVVDVKGPYDSRPEPQITEFKRRLAPQACHVGPVFYPKPVYQAFSSNPHMAPVHKMPVEQEQVDAILQLQQHMRQDQFGRPPTPTYTPEGTPPSLSNDRTSIGPPMQAAQDSTMLLWGDGPLSSEPHGPCTPAAPPVDGGEGAIPHDQTSPPSSKSRSSTPVMKKALRSRRLRKKVTRRV